MFVYCISNKLSKEIQNEPLSPRIANLITLFIFHHVLMVFSNLIIIFYLVMNVMFILHLLAEKYWHLKAFDS